MIQGEALKEHVRLAIVYQQLPDDTRFTCESCEDNEECESAFDMYNTDGDCLESK